MRRPIINRGHSAEIGRMKLLRYLEKRYDIAWRGLEIALDFGLDKLAKTCTIEIIKVAREIKERGGNCARVSD